MICNNKFWIESFTNLFCSFNLAPIPGESLEEQLNSLTRLVLVIFLVLLLLDYKYDLIFLFLSLLIIIILYYLQRKHMIEKFINTNYQNPLTQAQKAQNSRVLQTVIHGTQTGNMRAASQNTPQWDYNANVILYNTPEENSKATSTTPILTTPENNFWCNHVENTSKTFNNPNYISPNQKLANGTLYPSKKPSANPKTDVAPIIPPPITDSEYWKPTDLVIISGINDQKNVELSQSGYLLSNCCETPKYFDLPPNIANDLCECEGEIIENFTNETINLDAETVNAKIYKDNVFMKNSSNKITDNNNTVSEDLELLLPMKEYDTYFPYKTEGLCTDCCDGNNTDCSCTPNCKKNRYQIGPTFPGQILTSMGYNPDQLELHNIPSNLAVGKCEKDDALNCYNKDTFTSIIQPGVYSRFEIIEPIQSNIGISFDQQFEPVTCEKDCNGGVTFVSHDPKLIPTKSLNLPKVHDVTSVSNVYDPRFHGYGTSYRSYLEPVTGQTRFYYDDVEAIKKYNYITRNNIDFTDYGTSAGPMTKKEFCAESVRAKAQNTFVNDTIDHRTDLQERLMRKINANAWQQKKFPIITNVMTRGYGGSSMSQNTSQSMVLSGPIGAAGLPCPAGGGAMSGGSSNFCTSSGTYGGPRG